MKNQVTYDDKLQSLRLQIKEDILEKLRADKLEEGEITYGGVVRNFLNCLVRADTMGLEDSVGLNPNELDGGTIVAVLDYGGL